VEQRKSKKPKWCFSKHKAQIQQKKVKERPEFKAKPRDEEKSRDEAIFKIKPATKNNSKNNIPKEIQNTSCRESEI
jgi:hypothetical protein